MGKPYKFKRLFFKIGQIWTNLDPRTLYPQLRIVDFKKKQDSDEFPTWAICQARKVGDNEWGVFLTRIKLTRFRPYRNGYRLEYSPALGDVVFHTPAAVTDEKDLTNL